MTDTTASAACSNIVADTICRTAELGLSIDNAADSGDATGLFCQPVAINDTCPGCGQGCRLRDHVERKITDFPIAGFPSVLHVRVPRFRCTNDDCPVGIFRMSIGSAAADRQSVTHRVTLWILQRMASDGMSVRACARALGIGWKKTCALALAACRNLAYGDPSRLEHVRVLGVDEHKWKHRRGDGTPGYVTVIVDLTPQVDGAGPARLLDMVPGRQADSLSGWLAARGERFCKTVKTITMDGYSGYAKAATEQLPKARQVMDPFHVVYLAAQKLTECRQRVQRETMGRRGRNGDPLSGVRRWLLTRVGFLTEKRSERVGVALCEPEHEAVQVSWGVVSADHLRV